MYLVRHEGGERASNLVVVHAGLTGTKQDENESYRNRDLEDRLQQDCFIQPDESHCWLRQEIHAALQRATSNGNIGTSLACFAFQHKITVLMAKIRGFDKKNLTPETNGSVVL